MTGKYKIYFFIFFSNKVGYPPFELVAEGGRGPDPLAETLDVAYSQVVFT